MKTEAACDNKLQTFVKFWSNLEQVLIEFLKCEWICCLIENHGGLLLVEEDPNGVNSLEVVSRDFVELAFRGIQFLFVLGAHYLEVEL